MTLESDTAGGRLAALDQALRSHPNATLTLERWCETHGIATRRPALVTADILVRAVVAPTPYQRDLLRVSADTILHYRKVRLCCEAVVLSEAENWFVPARLPDKMNNILSETGLAFGRVVGALGYRRHLLAATLRPPESPDIVLEHRALLLHHGLPGRIADSEIPFSTVIERYRSATLAETRGSA